MEGRDCRLEYLIRPQTIAVIGATETEGFGGATSQNIVEWRKAGGLKEVQVFFVNPRRENVFGVPCYRSVCEIDRPLDVAVICTPRETVAQIMEELGRVHAKAAMVYASGFAELGAGGARFQAQLEDIAKRYQITLCGPNCAGIVNWVDGIPLFGIPVDPKEPGNVAILSQSGQLALDLISHQAVRPSYLISTGNEANVTLSDYLDFVVDDAQTELVAIYLEGVRDPRGFVRGLVKALRAAKPVIIVKVGRSEVSARVARAHTGSMVGSDRVFEAVCKSTGVIRVDDLDELVDHVHAALAMKVLTEINRRCFAVINLSGGEAAIAADLAALEGFDLPELGETAKERLAELLPPFATVGNPLDATAALAYDEGRFTEVLKTVMQDPSVKALVVGHNIPKDIPKGDMAFHDRVERVLLQARRETNQPIFAISAVSGPYDCSRVERLERGGICFMQGTKKSIRAIARAAAYFEKRSMLLEEPAPKVREIAVPEGVSVEWKAKEFLKRWGISVPRGYLATSPQQACEIAQRIGTFVAMKVQSEDVPHKTKIGGVRLNIPPDRAKETFEELVSSALDNNPLARIDGVLVEEMVSGGAEAMVGVLVDDQFGPVIAVGLGGSYVEALADYSLRLAPVTAAKVRDMLEETRLGSVLREVGREATSEFIELVVTVSHLAVSCAGRIHEIDLNPVIVSSGSKRAVVVDALFSLRQPQGTLDRSRHGQIRGG